MKTVNSIKVSDKCSLELLQPLHAEDLLRLIDRHREHLSKWLPWVENMQTIEHFSNYIKGAQQKLQQETDISFVITYNGEVAGRLGLHGIDNNNKLASVGYWIGKEFCGKGLVTNSCGALCAFAFETLDLNRIELRCGVENEGSNAVARRLQFYLEGVLRQAELVNGEFINLNCYALLKEDWKRHQKG